MNASCPSCSISLSLEGLELSEGLVLQCPSCYCDFSVEIEHEEEFETSSANDLVRVFCISCTNPFFLTRPTTSVEGNCPACGANFVCNPADLPPAPDPHATKNIALKGPGWLSRNKKEIVRWSPAVATTLLLGPLGVIPSAVLLVLGNEAAKAMEKKEKRQRRSKGK